ncbi:peptide/nickel transport system permease protein [Actinocorallia herbida]|uniref:Peptide/nickel transport system permease protein n=1 Tax=Actinocorallia herbida TaxID=58109 RepID=A0A3N1D644_9ACTN|nr:ABC transporter permease [Actinocorallia herbida]ROO89003.1 peptide/nickel transport system permease protein [Actinocorallia herbida]
MRRPGTLLAVAVLLLVAGWTVRPGWFTGQSAVEGTGAERFRPPGPRHLFGTDQLGRDVFARVVHGTAPSVQAAVLAIALGLSVGVALGLLAGFFGGLPETLVMRAVEIPLSIPPVLLSLTVISVLGFGTAEIGLAVGVTGIATFARVTRARVLQVRTSPHVEAARLSGGGPTRILLRHVLPFTAGPVLALAALDFGLVVLAVSSLGFLGYGAPPPAPEWGALVAGGRDHLATAWWLTVLPGLTVAAVVVAAGRVSRALQDGGRAA